MYTRGPGHRGVLLRVYAPRERTWREEGTRGRLEKREREREGGRRNAVETADYEYARRTSGLTPRGRGDDGGNKLN